jgi:hypothetical protein
LKPPGVDPSRVTTPLARLVAVGVALLALGALAALIGGLRVESALALLLVAGAAVAVVRWGARGAGRTRTRYW